MGAVMPAARVAATKAEPASTARLIEGSGTAEALWREALAAAGMATVRSVDLVAGDARLVIVAPHPDDELLACGGLAALHTGPVQVVAVTDGEASHADTAPWRAGPLAEARRAESAEGLRRLGLRQADVWRLGLPDGQVAAHAGVLQARLLARLRPADVVVSTWRGDGHPDHEATGRACAAACHAAGCRLLEAPVWMWHWARPHDARVPWRRLVGLHLAPATVARKLDALAAHVTQHAPRGAGVGPVLGVEILARAARPTEYYFV